MQTFLPYPGFAESAAVLDPKRLGKQRAEAIQILRGLTVPGYGWRHHPAVKMWAGYAEALVRYGLEICRAWVRAGHADTCAVTLVTELTAAYRINAIRSELELAAAGELPPWLGDPEFHLSHRSALLRKDPDWYGRFFAGVDPGLPYVWPPSDRTEPAAGPAPPA